MAKELRLKLEDGKNYSFRTLTLKETIAIRKETKEKSKEDEEIKKIEEKETKGEEPLTEEEQARLDKSDDDDLEFSIKICRMSLAKKHPEFCIEGEDKSAKAKSRKKINSYITELIDMPTLQQIVGFVMTGTVTKQVEEEYTYTEIIDLTEESIKK